MNYFSSLLRVLIGIIFSLTVTHTTSAQVWTPQNTGISNFIFTVKAVDENTVWAAASDGIYLRTTDGGTNWTSGTVPGAESVNFQSIAAIDSDTAYFVGSNFSEIDTRIYKTIDGGISWEMQYQNTSPDAYIDSIAFWDATHGIAVSDAVDGSFVILTTTNGGANWNQTPADNIPSPLLGEWAGFANLGGTGLAVAGSSHAWFGTAYGRLSQDPVRVLKSTDQGQTWTVTNTELTNEGQFHGIATIVFKDTLNGFAGSTGNSSRNNLARTTDGGQTWSLVSSSILNGLEVGTLAYVPQTDFQFLVATTSGGTVYSDDGGMTWMSLSSDQLWGISFVSPTSGWATSVFGISKFNGDITTVAVEQISEIPQAISLSQNYPNPFSSSTAIQFANDTHTTVTLKVFDVLGIEVAVLVNEALRPGTYRAVFEANGLPSGVYFYRLQAGEYVHTKTLTIVQ